jgi:hypothetical protein
MGIVFVFFGILRYQQYGGLGGVLGFAPGVGAIALGVAEYLPTRWRAVAIALRVIFLLSLVVLTILFFIDFVF